MKTLKNILIIAMVTLVPVLVVVPQDVSARTAKEIVCDNIGGADCVDADTGVVQEIIQKVINFLFLIISSVSVLVLIIAGLMYILSAGNPDITKKAKNTILYAVVGIAVAIFAQVIVRIILSAV